ncbi:hypothetical protein ACFL4T_04640 [candidate division KSB1 bacterium]
MEEKCTYCDEEENLKEDEYNELVFFCQYCLDRIKIHQKMLESGLENEFSSTVF